MSVIRDVVDVFKDISDYDEVEVLKNKPKGSLTRMTKDAVLQFPVIASNSLDIQLIGLVNKALERNFSTLLKIAFSLNSITDERDLIDYIRQFHQNTGLSDREYTSNMIVDKLVNECKIEYRFGETTLTESDKALIVHRLTEDNHRLLREYLNELNLDKLNDKMLYISESQKDRKIFKSLEELNNASKKGEIELSEEPSFTTSNRGKKNGEYSPSFNGSSKNKFGGSHKSSRETVVNKTYNINNNGGDVKSMEAFGREIGKAISKTSKEQLRALSIQNKKIGNIKDKEIIKVTNTREIIQKQPTKFTTGGKQGQVFTSADVNKANEIMPLPLEIKVYIEDGEGNIIERDFMIGVKAVIHPVSSEYMIDSMMDGYRRGKFFFNFIKATTGEIKFFRDFVFMVDNIKTDAIKNASGNNNKWFSFLRRRALLAKAKNTLRMKNQLLPNTSIVLSGEEADILKQQGVDILDPSVARDLISRYFLLSIVVIDPALEIVHIIYDGEENYSSMSVMALNREAKEDNSTKQILSLLKSRPQF